MVRLLTALLIIVDMIVLIVDLFNNPTSDDPLEYCSLAFSTYFMVEVTLRIFGLGSVTFLDTVLYCIVMYSEAIHANKSLRKLESY